MSCSGSSSLCDGSLFAATVAEIHAAELGMTVSAAVAALWVPTQCTMSGECFFFHGQNPHSARMRAAIVVAPAVVKIHEVQAGCIGGGCSGQLLSLQCTNWV